MMPPSACIKCGEAFFGAGQRCDNCRSASGRPRRPDTRPTNPVYRDARWRRLSASVLADWRASNGNWCPGFEVPAHAADDLTVDHAVGIADGGAAYDRTNTTVLCRSCNGRKGARSARPQGPVRVEPPARTWHGREVIALMGAPGSGKSTIAARYPLSVSTDALRTVARDAQGKLPEGASDAVYSQAFDAVAEALKANKTVVLDSPLDQPRTRARVLRIAKAFRAKARLVVLQTPVEVCIERQRGRLHPVPPDRVRAMHAAIVAQYPLLAFEGWAAVEWQ